MPARTVAVNDVELHVVEEGTGFPVIFAHGFPELAYSWRHQIPAVAAAGYRAVAPDQRGYGRSSKPASIADYDIRHLSDDLIGLLDELDEQQAIFVGHDWGSMVAWQTALLHPDRVAGVCALSVPFVPRSSIPPTERMRAVYADSFFYILYFQETGIADADLGADTAKTMRRALAGLRLTGEEIGGESGAIGVSPNDGRGFVDRLPEPQARPDWLNQEELDFYIEEFSRTGFTGGLNWYRNFDRNWEITPELAGARVEVPSFFVSGALDPVLLNTPVSVQNSWLTDHRGTVLIDDAGHWVQQEKPDEVNTALLGFLDSLRQEQE